MYSIHLLSFSDKKREYNGKIIPIANYKDTCILVYNIMIQLKKYIDKGYVYTHGYLQNKSNENVDEIIEEEKKINYYYELLEADPDGKYILDDKYIKEDFDKFPPKALKDFVEKNYKELLCLFEKQNKK